MQLIPEKFRQPFSNLNFHPKFKDNFFQNDQFHHYISQFRLQLYLLLLFSPIGLGSPSYLLSASFGVDSVGIGIGLFLVGLLLLLPWTLVPLLFLFTSFQANKWQRYGTWGYVGLLVISIIWWITFF